MSLRAFICLVDVGSDSDLLGFAQDLQDVLESQGYSVQYVHPWNLEAAGGPVAPSPTGQVLPSPHIQPPPFLAPNIFAQPKPQTLPI